MGEPKAPKPKRERPRLKILDGFRDPARRPRFILWSGAAVLMFAAHHDRRSRRDLDALVLRGGLPQGPGRHDHRLPALVTQRDQLHGVPHAGGRKPAVFLLHKAEALGELYLTVTDKYELPLNGESEVSLTMPSEQCTQCHDMTKRTVTTSDGIIIDHAVHAENEVSCTLCHNRIAHNEDFELTLTDPSTDEPNQPHAQFASMTACFRCHTQDKQVASLKAPGTCITCHPKDFQLKPASHLEEDFFPEGHGELGKAKAAEGRRVRRRSPARARRSPPTGS